MLHRRAESRYTGSGPPPPPPPGTTPWLPFDMPDLSASPKRLLGHFFYFPISLENAAPNNDYYSNTFLPTPTAVGGSIRDRHITRNPLSGDYRLQDATTQIQWAKSAGLDGFFVDILWPDDPANPGAAAWPLLHFTALINAAQSYPGFLVIPMLDVSGLCGGGVNLAPATMAARINQYFGKTSTYMVGATMIVGVYLPSNQQTQVNQAYLQSIQASCTAIGMTVKFAMVYSGGQQNFANYSAVSYSAGMWGPTSDASIPPGSASPNPASVRAAGLKFLAPVWMTDERPGTAGTPASSVWSESLNTLSLTGFWDEAIRVDADLIQACTWSDFTEGSEFSNTCMKGLVPADISAYYMVKWKTGAFPTITRDCIYLSHRNHVNGAPILGPQTQFMAKWSTGSATRYAVEALCFLIAPATVTINIGGTQTTFSAPAGMSRQIATVSNAGTVSVTAVRSGVTVVNLTSPIPIRPNLWFQIMRYCMAGSLRGTAGQFDCTLTSTGAKPTYP